MQKALIVFVAVASVLLIAAFMYFIRPQPCDGIFEQTAPQLKVKLGFIEANGEWAIGKEKIQQVDKDSQDVALHLKTCCIWLDKGSITPEQFQVCMNGAKEYEAKIIQITNIVGDAQEAKQQGKTELADQKAAEAKTVAGESTNVAGKVADDTKKLAQAVEKPSPAPGAKQYFFDDFKGKTLADHWEVIRPDPDNYAIENDGLLIINSKAGGLGDDNIPNLFRLKTAMPKGDWTATVKFSSEFPAAPESFFLALLQDNDHWTAATLHTVNYVNHNALFIGLSRKSSAEAVSWEGSLFTSGGGDWKSFISDNKLSQPIYLRLRRAGHDFIASSRLETSAPDAWVTVNKIASFDATGNLVLGFAQTSQGTGQTQATVEWVKIETP
jgi:hypothetical protein